ncbi:MAG: alpha/beta fold hydrolase [Saprospiraceae bacterium]
MIFDLNFIAEGVGIPLVFQHGLGGNLDVAKNMLSGLENVRLVCMDARGHGQTLFDETTLPSFNRYADDVIRVLDHLDIEKTVMGGISMGAGITLNLAVRYPERLLGLILVRPAWLGKPSPPSLDTLAELAQYVPQSDGLDAYKATESYKMLEAEHPGVAVSILGQFTREQSAHTATVLTRMIEDVPVPNLAGLSAIDLPCLILASDQDPLHPFHFGEVLREAIANAELRPVISRYVDDARHNVEVKEQVASFFAQYFLPQIG